MRLYVPASLDELDAVTLREDAALWTVAPRSAHAVTTLLRAELPDDDEEGLEYAAALEAADDSLALVVARLDVPAQRLVVTVDVPDDAVSWEISSLADGGEEEISASEVRVNRTLVDVAIVCVHVDEPEAAEDVRAVTAAVKEVDAAASAAAAEALDAAIERSTDRDLLWYDWSEIAQIPRV